MVFQWLTVKYLGVWIDQKLSPQKHLNFLFGCKKRAEEGEPGKKGKISFLIDSLSPCFKDISFEYRINLWITFIRPLFLPLAAMGSILTTTERADIQAKLRIALRKFLRLPKNFKTEILGQVFPIDFTEWMKIERENSGLKWEYRRQRKLVDKERLTRFSIPYRKYLPAGFGCLLKKFTAWCKECQKPFYPEHLEEHGIERIRIEHLFEDLKRIEEETTYVTPQGRKKSNRFTIVKAFEAFLGDTLSKVDNILRDYAEDFR